MKGSQLNAKALGLVAGIFSAIDLFLLALLRSQDVSFLWYNQTIFEICQTMIPGFTATMKGAFIGLFYGFVLGGLCFYLFGLVYNFFLKKL